MRKKNRKVVLVAGLLMCVSGGILFGIGSLSGGKTYVAASDLNRMDGSIEEEKFLKMEKTKLEEIQEMKIDLSDIDFIIKPSGDENYYLSYQVKKREKENPLEYEVKDGVLYLTEKSKNFHLVSVDLDVLGKLFRSKHVGEYRESVTFYVPSDKIMEFCQIEIGDGEAEIEGLQCKKADVQLDSGTLKITNSLLESGSISLNDGTMEIQDTTSNGITIKVGSGNFKAENFICRDSEMFMDDGKIEIEASDCENVEWDMGSGDFEVEESVFRDGKISLNDGNFKAGEITFYGEVWIKNSSGEVSLQIQNDCLEWLTMVLDSQDGEIFIEKTLEGQILERQSDDAAHYERRVEDKKAQLQVQCFDGEILIK